MDDEWTVTVEVTEAPTLGGGWTIGDLRARCEGMEDHEVHPLLEAWVVDRVTALLAAGLEPELAVSQAQREAAPMLDEQELDVRVAQA